MWDSAPLPLSWPLPPFLLRPELLGQWSWGGVVRCPFAGSPARLLHPHPQGSHECGCWESSWAGESAPCSQPFPPTRLAGLRSMTLPPACRAAVGRTAPTRS